MKENKLIGILMIVAMFALTVHIFHGAWSLFQSLGLNNPRFNAWRKAFAQGFAAIIVIGNLSFPIAVQTHIVTLKCPTAQDTTAPCEG